MYYGLCPTFQNALYELTLIILINTLKAVSSIHIPIYRWSTWAIQKLKNWPITHTVSRKIRIYTRAVCLQRLPSHVLAKWHVFPSGFLLYWTINWESVLIIVISISELMERRVYNSLSKNNFLRKKIPSEMLKTLS